MEDMKEKRERIGLIAGNGRFPILFAEGVKASNKEIIAIGIKGETLKELEGYVDKFYWVGIAQLGKLIKIFKNDGITNAVMAGGLTKTRVFSKFMNLNFIPDMKTVTLLYKIVKNRQDHSILGSIADELSKDGIELQPATLYVPELLAQKGVFTKRKPNEREQADIDFGWEIAKNIANMDIGQCIVVKEKVIMAVEAFEGTDETIKRGSNLGGKGCVVIKLSKKDQDIRFDLPTVGIETIEVLAKTGASTLAIEADMTLMLDKAGTIKAANDKKIAIVAI